MHLLRFIVIGAIALALAMSFGSSIAQIVIGAVNLNACPFKSQMPILLMTPGVCAVSGFLIEAVAALIFHFKKTTYPKATRIVKIITKTFVIIFTLAHSVTNAIVYKEFEKTFVSPKKSRKLCVSLSGRSYDCDYNIVINPAISGNANNNSSYCNKELFQAAQSTCLIGATCGFIYTVIMIFVATNTCCKKSEQPKKKSTKKAATELPTMAVTAELLHQQTDSEIV